MVKKALAIWQMYVIVSVSYVNVKGVIIIAVTVNLQNRLVLFCNNNQVKFKI